MTIRNIFFCGISIKCNSLSEYTIYKSSNFKRNKTTKDDMYYNTCNYYRPPSERFGLVSHKSSSFRSTC